MVCVTFQASTTNLKITIFFIIGQHFKVFLRIESILLTDLNPEEI